MATKKELLELGASHPDNVRFYARLLEDRENYLDAFKKLYDNILQINFSMACTHARHAALLENLASMQLMLEHDVQEAVKNENET